MDESPASLIYDKTYYTSYGKDGQPYIGNLAIMNTMENVAHYLVKKYKPKTHIDVGCAMGILMYTMGKRGVRSYGVEVSDYAVENAHPLVKRNIWNTDILDIDISAIDVKYDIVTCIEVIEHIPERWEDHVLDLLCAYSDIVFLSSELNFDEPTHVNVKPLAYWKGSMQDRGYISDMGYPSAIPWGRTFVKANSKKEISELLDRSSRIDVLTRDNYSCFLCGKSGVQVHEIIPKSAFGKSQLDKCFEPKNRVCLCPEHHGPAHTKDARTLLISLMSRRFGYKYDEPIYQKYMEDSNG